MIEHPIGSRFDDMVYGRLFMTRSDDDLRSAGMGDEHFTGKFGTVVLFGKMGEEQMTHESWLMRSKKLQCLCIG